MKRKKFEWTGRLILIIFSLILVLSLIFFITKQTHKNTTEQLLTEYMNYINKHEYEKMYKMISKEHSSNISMEEFVKRNKNIYEGLETKDLSIKILNEKSNGKEISYLTSFNTLAGEVKFQNEVNFIKEKFEYKKLRELGVSEEVIAELRDYDWNCFKQERNYKNHQMPDTDFIERTEDASGKWEIQQPVNVQDFIKSLDDNKLRKELQKLDQVTLYIILLKTFGYGTEEIGKLLGMKANTVSARMKRLRKKLKKYFF